MPSKLRGRAVPAGDVSVSAEPRCPASMSSGGLTVLMYALAEGGTRGLDDPRVILTALAGMALLAVFAILCLITLLRSRPAGRVQVATAH